MINRPIGCLLIWLVLSEVGAMALEWDSGDGFRSRKLLVSGPGRAHLAEVFPDHTGVTFRSDVPEEKGIENSIRLAGTGAAAGDVDGDGRCDLFFCSMGGRSGLFRNLGDWRFEDITATAGVACEGQDSTGAAFADVDGDGDLDLLINSLGGGTRLFLNDAHAHFMEAADCGLLRRNGSISMTLADVDGNGTLDLYVVNYARSKIEDRPTTKIETATVNGQLVVTALDGVPVTSPDLANRYYIDRGNTIRELGEPDTLYLNDGGGKFTPVSWTGGFFLDKEGVPLALPPYDWGLSAMFRDMNGDSLPDLYVCNDLFTPDRIWINDGRGHFREMPALGMRQSSLFSMGVDFADINRDGHDDFIVVDMLSPSLAERKVQVTGVQSPRLTIGRFDDRPHYKRNTLFLNRGDSTYAEIGQLSGLEATGWSWSPVFLDVDLDGYDDLLVTAGYYRDALNADVIAEMKKVRASAGRALTLEEYRVLKKQFPPLPQQCKAFRNRGDLTFEDKSAAWGFGETGIAQGICLADLDDDGDLDVIVVRQNGPVALYQNQSVAPRIAVRLKGKAPNTRGIGAGIKLLGADLPQSQEMICGGRYLCADDAVRVFAVPGAARDLRLEVTWRGGVRSVIAGIVPNRLYEIDEPATGSKITELHAAAKRRVENGDLDVLFRLWPAGVFENASPLLSHTHRQPEFDDFERQPSLPQKLSQAGPGVGWLDTDDDGHEELLIGAARGGSLAVFQNTGSAKFTDVSDRIFGGPAKRSSTAILTLDKTRLLIGWDNYDDPQSKSTVELVDLAQKTFTSIAEFPESIGPLAVADINGDGELDLFVGGRAIPGRYPEPVNSYLFLGHRGQFEADRGNREVLASLGLVSGAVFSDLDGDGFPELILACQWGPLRVFHNDRGKFAETTRKLGLAAFTGLWNGVAAGDFDGDGRMDLVASNLGRNTKFQSYRSKPLRLYYGQVRLEDEVACLVASFDDRDQKWRPHCDYDTAQLSLPGITRRFPTHTAYSLATVDELLEGEVSDIKMIEAACLDSTLFLNRGDHFEARPLPVEAQFAPAFGLAVADFDGDGAQDIFLSQNFFGVDGTTARYDAGRGLLLKGLGNGRFSALSGDQSGIKLYGEQRACAVADYDGDGRVDLVVTQNGGPTALFHNHSTPMGLRVKLHGVPGNPRGVGAVLRLVRPGGLGAACEVHAGFGYLSQDSPTLVLHSPVPASAVRVRWPGGAVKTYPVPKGVGEVELAAP